MVALPKQPPHRMTVAEFLAWNSGDPKVVNSTRVEAELLRRDADGTWPELLLRIGPEDALSLDSIGFTVPLAALHRTTTLATPEGNPP
jgi:hypothetical protein